MTGARQAERQDNVRTASRGGPAGVSPFLRAPEGARAVFLVILFAVCGPLAGGGVLFGWRGAWVTVLSVVSCAVTERVFYRVTRVPALLGRTHGVLTGVLLALTLPAHVPWHVPVVAGAFAILVGKAVFGGVGHFVWHPALVGRLAVAVLYSTPLSAVDSRFEDRLAVLARGRLVFGDVRKAEYAEDGIAWERRPAPREDDAHLLTPPVRLLRGLTRGEPQYGALVYRRQKPERGPPAALLQMPPVNDLLWGARPGGIGETGVILIVVAGLYLVYRTYVKWPLPFAFCAAAWVTVAVAPIGLVGPGDVPQTLWLPILSGEGLDVGFTYVNYQVLSGELLLAALLASVEMTSRPVTTGGQVIFGAGCGALAMALQLYTDVSIPCYMAVLAMNTLTPTIDRFWRPRVFGMRRFGRARV